VATPPDFSTSRTDTGAPPKGTEDTRSDPRLLPRARSQLTAAPRSRRMPAVAGPSQRQRIYAVVRRIPRGRVATYGQVAFLAGLPGHARQVGYALAALEDGSRMPWHRVLNAQGGISLRKTPGWDDVQRQLLRREGVAFDRSGRTSLRRYQWQPRRAL